MKQVGGNYPNSQRTARGRKSAANRQGVHGIHINAGEIRFGFKQLFCFAKTLIGMLVSLDDRDHVVRG